MMTELKSKSWKVGGYQGTYIFDVESGAVIARTRHSAIPKHEARANARLIAAAPALYAVSIKQKEATVKAFNQYDSLGFIDIDVYEDWEQATEELEAALALAEGDDK